MQRQRIGFAVGIICLAGLLTMAILNWLKNPVEARYGDVANLVDADEIYEATMLYGGENGETGNDNQSPAARMRNEVASRADLWTPLVQLPPPPAPPPDWNKLLKGISLTGIFIGEGADRKTKIFKDPKDSVGEWIGAGSRVNGIAVKSVTADSVVFNTYANGKEYEYRMLLRR